jgi:cobalt/nickel transport system permease protein
VSGAAHGGNEELLGLDTPLHRLPPQTKVAALGLFALAVALTPTHAAWAVALHLLLVLAAATVAQIPPGDLLRRLVIEVPFVLFVIVLPFVATGEQVHVLGIPLAIDGLWLAFGIVAKASLVLLGTAVLAACTPPASILAGAERLHAPRVMTAIAGFAIRYVEVILAELQRMRTARIARGDDPRFLWQARAVIRSAGTLLVRCFERGERVQLAMVSRGWDGGIPAGLLTAPASRLEWAGALSLPAFAIATVVAARIVVG